MLRDIHTGVILDTDIGYDSDDFIALLLLLDSTELTLDLIVTGDEVLGKRARLVGKILRTAGRLEIPVISGADLGNQNFIVDDLIQDCPPLEACQNPIGDMKLLIDKFDEIVYINIQGFSNLSALITTYPEVKKKLKVFQMGGALDYSRDEGWIEHNVRIDTPSAQKVIEAELDMTLIMAQTTMIQGYQFNENNPVVVKLRDSNNPLHKMLYKNIMCFHEKLIQKGVNDPWPYAHDPLVVAVALGKNFVQFEDITVSMNNRGELLRNPHGKKIKGSLAESRAHEFMEFLSDRLF